LTDLLVIRELAIRMQVGCRLIHQAHIEDSCCAMSYKTRLVGIKIVPSASLNTS